MRNWLEVDLSKLQSNVDTVKSALPENCEIIAVVKANAYGHGEVNICRALDSMGVRRYAVASLEEAMYIREEGIGGDILVLSYIDPEDVAKAANNNITLAAISYPYTEEVGRIAASLGLNAKMHMKINTGMNRVGFDCRTDKDLELIADAYRVPGTEFTGIFSHFSSSDDLSEGAEEYTRMQLANFEKVLDFLEKKGIDPGLRHISNSGGIGKYKEARFDAVRCGALMYGYNTAFDAPMDVHPIGTWRAKISCIRTLEEGDAVSYSRHYKAKGGERIATLCVGYADGYKRALSGKEDGPRGFVLVNGVRCPIVGNICMDQMMADVSGAEAQAGDAAVLMGEGYTADDLADAAGTCMHDILASIGPRVERVYVQ
ncbi:MAG: alanine racemase [Firmicutes bacterium]|nr:alanine racemase [Bacillota bacterium]